MVSIIGIIGTWPIVIVFGICSGLVLRSYLKNPNRTKIFYLLWTMSTALIYVSWGLRVLFIPQFTTDKIVLYPFWAVCYGFGGLALISLDFASLDQIKNRESTLIKIIRIIILASFSLVLIILFTGFDQDLTIFMDVSDLTIKNPFVYFYFTFVIMLYIFFPNAIFINYLIKSDEKDTFTYKRVRIIELGILVFSISLALDGMRFPSNIGILIIRIFLMIGGLITMKGFLMKPIEKYVFQLEKKN